MACPVACGADGLVPGLPFLSWESGKISYMSQLESYRKFLIENLEKSCFYVRRRLAMHGGALLFLGGKVYKRMFL